MAQNVDELKESARGVENRPRSGRPNQVPISIRCEVVKIVSGCVQPECLQVNASVVGLRFDLNDLTELSSTLLAAAVISK